MFDVAYADAMTTITIAEDKDFLEDQHGPRIGYMGSVDTALAAKKDRKAKILKRYKCSRYKENERTKENIAGNESEPVADELTSDQELTMKMVTDNEVEYLELAPGSSSKQTKRRSVPVVTPELSAALDQANISNENAAFLLAESARSLQHQQLCFDTTASNMDEKVKLAL